MTGDILKFAIDRRSESIIEINAVDHHDWSYLTLAVLKHQEKESLDVIEKLLELEVDPHIESDSGKSAVHCAAHLGHSDLITLFVKHNVDLTRLSNPDPQAYDSTAKTPLHYMIQYDHNECLRIALLGGADPFVQDAKGNTLLHYCSVYSI